MPLFEVVVYHETIPATVAGPAKPGAVLIGPVPVVAKDPSTASLLAMKGLNIPEGVDESQIVVKYRSFT